MTEGDKVITISKFIDDHVRFFPSTKSKLIQINRGIDTQYFDLNAVTEQKKREFIIKTYFIRKCSCNFTSQQELLLGKVT